MNFGIDGRKAISSTLRAGIHGLVKSLSREVATDGVTINAVLPGYTATSAMTPRRDVLERIPAGRMATPDDQGALCAFLASEPAAYITGQTIACDGGYLHGH